EILSCEQEGPFMSEQPAGFNALAARLEELEKQNRRLKRGGLAILVVGCAAFLMGSQEHSPDQKSPAGDPLSLRDAQGKERARWAVGPEGVVLRFLDENGIEQASMGSTREGMAFRLLDPKGRLVTGFSLERTGVALVTTDERGRLL